MIYFLHKLYITTKYKAFHITTFKSRRVPCKALLLLFHNKIIHHFFKCCCSTGIQLLQLQPIVNNHGVRPQMIQEGLPNVLTIAGNEFWKLVQAFTLTIIADQSLYSSLLSLYTYATIKYLLCLCIQVIYSIAFIHPKPTQQSLHSNFYHLDLI